MSRPSYPIATARLLLRPYAEADYPALCDLFARPEVMRYFDQGPLAPESVRELLADRIGNVALEREGDYLSLVVTLKDDPDTAIGNVMLHWTSEQHGGATVGYTLHPGHWGHGYATEATRALIDLGFREVELHRIVGKLDARNTASHRVLTKSGMRTEANLVESKLVKSEWTSEIVCAVLRSEWKQAQLLD
ncbi:MAG TPA: GNAT family N-acetyltransferase [Pseudonocardiaceae bacterium]|jgi:RimJ/RimL family protein N-acetyltransferase